MATPLTILHRLDLFLYNTYLVASEKFKNYLNQVWGRFNLEGTTFAGMLGVLSTPLSVVHAVLTKVLHESSEQITDDQLWVIAIAMMGLVDLVGIPLETRALKKKHYSASLSASTIYDSTGHAWLGATVNHLLHYPRAFAFNPVIYTKIAEAVMGGNGPIIHTLKDVVTREGGRLAAESIIGVTITYGLWSIAFNHLILTERAEPVVDRIRQMWTKVFHIFRGRQDQMAEIDLIQ